jgi:hypothetical protein
LRNPSDWAARDPMTDFTVNANGTLSLLLMTREFCPDQARYPERRLTSEIRAMLSVVHAAMRERISPALAG